MRRATCGRCGKEIEEDEAEVCWWCEGNLCYDCWERYGHCGHPEADEANAQMREWYRRQEAT